MIDPALARARYSIDIKLPTEAMIKARLSTDKDLAADGRSMPVGRRYRRTAESIGCAADVESGAEAAHDPVRLRFSVP
jgi:hypothetical protein